MRRMLPHCQGPAEAGRYLRSVIRRQPWTTILALAVSVVATQCRPSPTFDVLILGGRLIDGTGAPWFRGDLAITGSHIAAIGNLSHATAKIRIVASDLVVAP